MNRAATRYNERSWAIDLIGHLKAAIAKVNRPVKDAGGEQTVSGEGGSLFPDVLLFGDRANAVIMQGWELKMPDTPIDDADFRINAEAKARALGLDSFVLWNVATARLYVLDDGSGRFALAREWTDLADISSRSLVISNRARWEALAEVILATINDLLTTGEIEGRPFIESYRTGGITGLLMVNAPELEAALKRGAIADTDFDAEMESWWISHGAEYSKGTREGVLAQAILSNWIAKILFANILREQDDRARVIEDLKDGATPDQALDIFRHLSEQINFWTIFSDSLGLSKITPRAWDHLLQFNGLLRDLRVGSVDQAQLSEILESTVEVAIRKFRGQYPTPFGLARLVARLAAKDISQDRVIDPCCGSGTIARANAELKLITGGVAPGVVAGQVYASDQDPQAVQLATFALTSPEMIHSPIRVFRHDAFLLTPDTVVQFTDPSNGSVIRERLGQFDALTTNLPFVAQAGRKQYGNALAKVKADMGEDGKTFTGRSDVAAYLPLSLAPIVRDGGRIAMVITNSWLGTAWGDAFYRELSKRFEVKTVITSGAGRWFGNSDVVTNVIVAEKLTRPNHQRGPIKFVALKRRIDDVQSIEDAREIAMQIVAAHPLDDVMTLRTVSVDRLEEFRRIGLSGSAQFVDCDWALDLPLVPLASVADIRRGERRGMNDFFYPKDVAGIEDEYLVPLAKNAKELIRLTGRAQGVAFSCSRSVEELDLLGHTGALDWIEAHATPAVVERLSKPGKHWYQMDTDDLSSLVATVGYGERIFVGRLDPPAFCDQRLVPITATGASDEILHALLNTTVSMFLIEGLGFGRGLGVLDLNKDRMASSLQVLDPTLLDRVAQARVLEAFAPLLGRDILKVPDELDAADRQWFDDIVLREFGIEVERERIYDAMRALYEIRMAAIR